VSETLMRAAQLANPVGQPHEIELRGRSATLHVYAIKNAATLEL
jgi:hypothetical protein